MTNEELIRELIKADSTEETLAWAQDLTVVMQENPEQHATDLEILQAVITDLQANKQQAS